jgi:hypothetical protein
LSIRGQAGVLGTPESGVVGVRARGRRSVSGEYYHSWR